MTCSTPFGIKDQISRRFPEYRHGAGGAQRLSASKIKSLGRRYLPGLSGGVLNAFRHQRSNLTAIAMCNSLLTKCSTPFGIKDQISLKSRSSLNIMGCAQRLSASKIKSLWLRSELIVHQEVLNAFRHQRSNLIFGAVLGVAPGSAQRLSASKIKSPGQSERRSHISLVLNAFRHQRSNLSFF